MFLFEPTVLSGLSQNALILLVAILLDAAIGDPDWLWSRVRHPVVVIGNVIGWTDDQYNRTTQSTQDRKRNGSIAIIVIVAGAAAIACIIVSLLGSSPVGLAIQACLVAAFLAGHSLHTHVQRVAIALQTDGLAAARHAVSMIVGRDPTHLDESGVARAAIESTAENFADGVVAPAFWFLVAGLPGIVIYKTINTADSMIGHKTERHRDFGWAAARIDDLANVVPARLSGLFVACGGAFAGHSLRNALTVMWHDARKHVSPNAGWPETAMAGALGIALAGPRVYAEHTSTDPWLNEGGRKGAGATDIEAALKVLRHASLVQLAIVMTIAIITNL